MDHHNLQRIVSLILGLFTVCLNMFTIIVCICQSFKKTNRRLIYLCSLSTAGVIIGVGNVCLFLTLTYTVSWVCVLSATLKDTGLMAILLHMLLLALDRWNSVHKPFSYISNPSRHRVCMLVALAWSIAIVFNVVLTSCMRTHSITCIDSSSSNDCDDLFMETSWTHSQSNETIQNASVESFLCLLLPTKRHFNNKTHTDLSRGSLKNKLESETVEPMPDGIPMFSIPLYHKVPRSHTHANVSYIEESIHHACITGSNSLAVFFVTLFNVFLFSTVLGVNCSAFTKARALKRVKIRRSISSSPRQRKNSNLLSRSISLTSYTMTIHDTNRRQNVQDQTHLGDKIQLHTTKERIDSQELDDPRHNLEGQGFFNLTKYTPTDSMPHAMVPALNTARPKLMKMYSASAALPARRFSFMSLKVRAKSWSISVPWTTAPTLEKRKSNSELASTLLKKQDRGDICWLVMLTAILLGFWLPHTVLQQVTNFGLTPPMWLSWLCWYLLEVTPILTQILYSFSNAMFRRAMRNLRRPRSKVMLGLATNYSMGASVCLASNLPSKFEYSLGIQTPSRKNKR